MIIVGAGLAGLIAAHAFPKAYVLEAMPRPTQMHKALLRFRSNKVAVLTRTEFRPVLVRKGIWSKGAFVSPSIGLANAYSQKVIGNLAGDRSIWNLDPVERWIAPEDFYWQLIDSVNERLCFDRRIESLPALMREAEVDCAISTMPMGILVKQLGIDPGPDIEFKRAPINVQRFRITGDCNLHQTVYFPDDAYDVYRASITGDLLIVESALPSMEGVAYETVRREAGMHEVMRAFHLHVPDLIPLEDVQQQYGKIAPIDDGVRKRIIGSISEFHNIYSVGRFATWKNLLLDDLIDDLAVVKKLIASSDYDKRLLNSKR